MLADPARKSLQVVKALLTRRLRMECDRVPYEFQRLPLKKILNWLLVEGSIYLKPRRPWGWPTHLQVEPTNLCNLRCAFCPVTTGMDRPSGSMDVDVFKKLIDEIGDYLFIILFWDWGEPSLNAGVYEMISYAGRRGIKTVLSTNGHLYARGDHAERLVRSGLDSVICAVDGIAEETYNRYRRSGDVNRVIAGVKQLAAARRALGSVTPLINFRFIPMKHNEHEIPRLREFAQSIGADALTLKTLNPYDGGECSSDEADGNEFLPENPAYQRFRYDPVTGQRIRRKRNPCKTLWNNPVIHWNGKVCPCAFDPHDHYALGDLSAESFAEIWSGPSYRELRRRFREDYQQVTLCSDCSYAFEGGSCSTEIIAEAQFFGQAE
jgi:radical SAM protein with 4Fe4S-binding SPASM domain